MVDVLVVDDEPSYRDAARMVLELSPGFQLVGEAETGLRSVELAPILRPDLVLMDVDLPDVDGFEATRRIRATGARPPIVVLLSAHEVVDGAGRALGAGAAGMLSKSMFTPDELQRAWAQASTQIS